MPYRRRQTIDAAIFDLDGTLLDSAPQIAAGLNVALRTKDLPIFDGPEVAHHIGWGSLRLIETTFASRGVTLDLAEAQRMEAIYLEAYARLAEGPPTFFDGAVPVLRLLHERHVRLGLSTNKPEAITRTILRRAGIEDLFGAIIGGDSGFGLKPSPAPVEAARRKLGTPVHRTIFIGDSAIDATAAFGAELPFAHIQHPGHPVPKLSMKPQWQLNHLSQILAIIEEREKVRDRA